MWRFSRIFNRILLLLFYFFNFWTTNWILTWQGFSDFFLYLPFFNFKNLFRWSKKFGVLWRFSRIFIFFLNFRIHSRGWATIVLLASCWGMENMAYYANCGAMITTWGRSRHRSGRQFHCRPARNRRAYCWARRIWSEAGRSTGTWRPYCDRPNTGGFRRHPTERCQCWPHGRPLNAATFPIWAHHRRAGSLPCWYRQWKSKHLANKWEKKRKKKSTVATTFPKIALSLIARQTERKKANFGGNFHMSIFQVSKSGNNVKTKADISVTKELGSVASLGIEFCQSLIQRPSKVNARIKLLLLLLWTALFVEIWLVWTTGDLFT